MRGLYSAMVLIFAWLLWERGFVSDTEMQTWKLRGGFYTKWGCGRAAREMVPLGFGPVPTASNQQLSSPNPNGGKNAPRPSRIVDFLCLPDTIDPREKGKS
jgi:hypothetical protein